MGSEEGKFNGLSVEIEGYDAERQLYQVASSSLKVRFSTRNHDTHAR